MKQQWYVYIARCGDNSLYTGITTDIERRMREHNAGPRSAKYTRARTPVKLAYSETAVDRSTASRREAMLKKFTRTQKLSLISKMGK